MNERASWQELWEDLGLLNENLHEVIEENAALRTELAEARAENASLREHNQSAARVARGRSQVIANFMAREARVGSLPADAEDRIRIAVEAACKLHWPHADVRHVCDRAAQEVARWRSWSPCCDNGNFEDIHACQKQPEGPLP